MEDQWSPVGLAFGDNISGEMNMTNSISVLWYSGDRHYKKMSDCLYQPTLTKHGKVPAQPFLLMDNAEDGFSVHKTASDGQNSMTVWW